MKAFAPYIDDNLASGRISLPDTGYDILNEKIDLVQQMVEAMLADNTVRVVAKAPGEKGETTFTTYTVQAGDTLSTIAAKYSHLSTRQLMKDNEITDPRNIPVGRQLKVRKERSKDNAGDLYIGIFNVNSEESYETDPEKLGFAQNIEELRERWRKILKSQVISKYLDLMEEQAGTQDKAKETADLKKKKSEEELWQEAIAKVAKRNRSFFQRLHQETLQDHYSKALVPFSVKTTVSSR